MTKVAATATGRQVVRDLPRALPGDHGHRGQEKRSTSKFSPDFFDLIVIDECHRGSAARGLSAWREILDYFEPAIQLGMTATPKETTRRLEHLTTSASRSTRTRSSRASRTASSRPTRSSASTSTRTCWAGGPRTGRPTTSARTIEDRIYNQRDFDRDRWFSTSATSASPRRIVAVPARRPTRCARRSCSARTSTTPSGCARRS